MIRNNICTGVAQGQVRSMTPSRTLLLPPQMVGHPGMLYEGKRRRSESSRHYRGLDGWEVGAVRVSRRGLPKAKVFKAPRPAAWRTVVRKRLLQDFKAHGHQHPNSIASGLQDLDASQSGLEGSALGPIRTRGGQCYRCQQHTMWPSRQWIPQGHSSS